MLSKPTKSGNSYYHYSANNTQTGDIKEQELSGQSEREVGLNDRKKPEASASC